MQTTIARATDVTVSVTTGVASIHEPSPGKLIAICLTGDCTWDTTLYGGKHEAEIIAGRHLRDHHN